MGLSVPRDDAVHIHRWVGGRLIVMAFVHGMAHVLWIGKDGLQKYSKRVWQNDFLPQLPFWTGVFMLLAVLLTLPAYFICKDKRYGTFRFLKRSSSVVFIFLGLFHGDGGALRSPTMWSFLLLVIVYFALDQGLQRAQFHEEHCHFEHFQQEGDTRDSVSVLCLELGSSQGQDQSGHVRLQVRGVPSWQPFTLAQRQDGRGELHIKLAPKVQEDQIAAQYANWSSLTKSKVIEALHYHERFRICWTGPFGGVLSNRDLYQDTAVIFVCWGTGFTAVTQGMHSLAQLNRSNAYVFWRGDGSIYETYFQSKVRPICQEYAARNMLQEWRGSETNDRMWDRHQLNSEFLNILQQHQDVLVTVGMCGPSAACKSVTTAIEDHCTEGGNGDKVKIYTEAFG
ncbi:unnamed protein product [Durusdinium trenchii]|uniref:Ferric oxidoreductase domain-containing protein n=2 Tax=Durusdinium trenchii TaxID=1381693 RepID=A0ABP0KYN6_9DINO